MAKVASVQPPLDTATIDSYQRDVLRLPEGQNEDDLDANLRKQAQELGLILEALVDGTQTTSTPPEESPRYSESVDSRISISTDLTSVASERDRASIFSSNAADQIRSTRSSLTDISPSRRQSTSSSTFSVSTTSTNQSSKSPFRRIKGLSMLRLHRSSSKGCPHCPKDSTSQRRALHEMPCGHRLCTQALRNVVLEAIRRSPGAAPQCCEIAIPERYIRHVLDDDEYKVLYKIGSAPGMKYNIPSRPLSLASRVDSLAPAKDVERIKAPEHKSLCMRQEAEGERFEKWAARMKTDLERQRTEMVQLLQEHQLKVLDEQAETHGNDMLVAEDRQVKAEADLRSLQDQEIRDNSTALKHMEAYCQGTLASGESHNRTITDQDLNELQKTRNMRDAMELKHANAINILRGEQTRRMKMRSQRHEKEVQQLQAKHRKEILALEQRSKLEQETMLEDCVKKRHRLQARWRLETLICLRRLDDATNNENILPAMVKEAVVAAA